MLSVLIIVNRMCCKKTKEFQVLQECRKQICPGFGPVRETGSENIFVPSSTHYAFNREFKFRYVCICLFKKKQFK